MSIDFRSEDLESVLTAEFGVVHRDIGILLENFRCRAMFRVTADPNAGANRAVPFSDENRLAQHIEAGLGDPK